MRFTVKIDCDNSAFGETPEYEVARLLRDLAEHVVNGTTAKRLYDSNGNEVGEAKFTGKRG